MSAGNQKISSDIIQITYVRKSTVTKSTFFTKNSQFSTVMTKVCYDIKSLYFQNFDYLTVLK